MSKSLYRHMIYYSPDPSGKEWVCQYCAGRYALNELVRIGQELCAVGRQAAAQRRLAHWRSYAVAALNRTTPHLAGDEATAMLAIDDKMAAALGILPD